MDAAWNFRNAYNEARKIKDAQDEFCRHAEAGRWKYLEDAVGHGRRGDKKKLPPFPEDLQWESLVDVLRGRVKVCSPVVFFCIMCLELSSCLCIVMRSVSSAFRPSSF